MDLRKITFDEILPMWNRLWEGRKSPIQPVTSMVYLGGYDLSIKTAYTPTFFGIYDGENLVAVNSGVQTADKLYRIRGLYVDPEHRKKGFAIRLLETVCEQGLREECSEIWAMPRKATSYPILLQMGFLKTSEWFEDKVEFGPNCYMIRKIDV
jgi:GNAT superfamily N-acetyltransferase